MKPQSAKQKGKLLEDYIADEIIKRGLDNRARRDGASGAGNREKSDIATNVMILGRNIGIEAKNQKTLKIPEWWRQTEKLEKVGKEPILVFKLPNDRYNNTLAVIRLDTLLDLIKYQKDNEDIEEIIAGSNYEKGELYRAVEYFIPKLKKIKSLLDPRK